MASAVSRKLAATAMRASDASRLPPLQKRLARTKKFSSARTDEYRTAYSNPAAVTSDDTQFVEPLHQVLSGGIA